MPPIRPHWPPLLLGFALGGFFDGILLHQILGWHHLLSLVPGAGGLRRQVLWDGLFHALMYAVALLGLWGLWRRRHAPSLPLLAPLLAGFGLWHVVDALLAHWLLGLHHIRLDRPNPVAWDLLWLGLFGAGPMLLASRLWRRRARTRASHALALAALVLLGGAVALRGPDPAAPTLVAGFGPDMPRRLFTAMGTIEGRLLWIDTRERLALVQLAPAQRWRLLASGLLPMAGSGLPAGCATWSTTMRRPPA